MSFSKQTTYACSPNTTRGQPLHLGGDPKGKNFLYSNGRVVFIRNIENPLVCEEYTEHAAPVTVAKYSPSGYYIASGDTSGKVRIWDTTQSTHILKNEVKALGSRIHDLAWDFESKRIIAVGEGREKYGAAFSFDSGNSMGEITGHSKVINSVAIRQARPFTAVTVSDDFKTAFYKGPPFKVDHTLADHSRFVTCVRYSPNNEKFITVGTDGKIFMYSGDVGVKDKEIAADGGHSGGIYSFSWSPDSKSIVTGSGDCSTKIWDVNTSQVVSTYLFSTTSDVDSHQVGTLWQGQYILSLSLSGDINYIDPRQPKPSRTLKSHQKPITAFDITPITYTMFTGSYDSRVYSWAPDAITGTKISGPGHNTKVSALAASTNSTLFSIGMDDTLRCLDTIKLEYMEPPVALGSQPDLLAAGPNGLCAVHTADEAVHIYLNMTKINTFKPATAATALAFDKSGRQLAIGSVTGKVHLYNIENEKVVLERTVESSNKDIITDISFSNDGTMVVVADSFHNVVLYDRYFKVLQNNWTCHSGRVNCVDWSPNNRYIASGGLDTNIYVWNVAYPSKHIEIKNAHQNGVVRLRWVDDNTLASVGSDACIRKWSIQPVTDLATSSS